MNYNKLWYLILLAGIIWGCTRDDGLNNWTLNLDVVGSNGSPKCEDLNKDGILDIVIGSGRNEFEPSKIGIIAINGKNGDTLWIAPATDQIYGAAIFQDVNNDDIPDVYIGGRSKNFYCLNGKNGKRIWEYEIMSDEFNAYGFARFNFFNPRFIQDLNNDNIQELLVQNSGNVYAAPFDTINRYPGVLMIMDGANGEIISLDTIPDGKESYMSPVLADFNNDGNETLIFGSGGETVSGSLYAISIDSLLTNNLSNPQQLLEYKNQHGFIAPPTIADFNNDGKLDLLALNHGGYVTLHDGSNDFELIWKIQLEGVELNAMATIGKFNGDDILDIFINGAKGQWPKNTGSKQFFIDGKDGRILKTYELGCSGFSSPLTINADEDPLDEALLYINDFDCIKYNTMFCQASMYIFGVDTISQFAETFEFGKNISSTPWVGDLDGDELLDIIAIIANNTQVFHEFLGIKVFRYEFNFSSEDKIKWGSYMNEGNRCIYE